MIETLLKKLNDSDINWIISNSRKQRLSPDDILIHQRHQAECLYIVLEGTFSAIINRNPNSTLAGVFATLESNDELEEEIGRFFAGEVLGEASLLNFSPSATTVKAIEDSVVLSISSRDLRAKLRQDIGFASRFYQAIAILLLERFERLVKKFTSRRNVKIPALQDGPMLFGELSDSDVDWIIEHSYLETISPGTVLIRAGRAVENIYILIQGSMSVYFKEENTRTLTNVFSLLETSPEEESPGYEIATSSVSEIIGETTLVDNRLPNYTFTALETSKVLVIKKQLLFVKLQQNSAIGARFYRLISILISVRLQSLINRLGYGRSSYGVGHRLSENLQYDDEIDVNLMDNLFTGGARFDWMLKRLKVLS
ncbi:cyclic nucleotide-binding domain-containing protein [Mastigocoleus testarum]|uniref:Bacteriocin-type transport-associated protein n=1 Tax=Mastigocoleus testarum BC008 TaxID=371196 RepID=A0A0V7ZER6_9CYAN|nr:cyclic nucleotide-binding domain-containing protein [Mastigocoleus testarum]KST62927.1 bacteriocin-type transport-associated protein [Mastigocoleus testarum BC008]KST63018.1 bacteriocin-type transport-associated protein [Mastigocoleus testarum BC008]